MACFGAFVDYEYIWEYAHILQISDVEFILFPHFIITCLTHGHSAIMRAYYTQSVFLILSRLASDLQIKFGFINGSVHNIITGWVLC